MGDRTYRTKLEEVLRERGHTVAWFARRIDYDYSHTWQIMRGIRGSSARFRARCAEALGLPESELFDVETEPEAQACAS